MAKTYTSVPNVATGDVLTASAWNTGVAQNINNLRVPPSCMVRRTTNLTGYTAGTAIAFESAGWDTEGPSDPMWSIGSPTRITIKTAGIYVVTFHGYWTATATVTVVAPSISKSGSGTAAIYGGISAGTNGYFSVTATLSLAAADYLTCDVGFVGGSAYAIGGAATEGIQQTRLAATWLGQVS